MGLITETNQQYYAGQQTFIPASNSQTTFTTTFDTDLVATVTGVSNTNFEVYVNNALITAYTLQAGNNIVLTNPPGTSAVVKVQLLDPAIWNNNGEYAYITLNDVVDNFLVAYVGDGKYITNVKRTDVLFHAKRGLQEFSYDTLNSIKSQEITIPNSLSISIPQDYVNYTRLSWVDPNGVQRTIYPANELTMDPQQPLIQSDNGDYIQNNLGENQESDPAVIEKRWKQFNQDNLSGRFAIDNLENSDVYNWAWWKTAYGQRYGLEPSTSQSNGWFTIDSRKGKFGFSSQLAGQVAIIEYISDGLAYNKDSKIPKMIEEAMYMHIAYSILSSRINVPEYVVHRFKKDRRAQLRNAKIRLQNLKLDTLIQVMRNKSKWIK